MVYVLVYYGEDGVDLECFASLELAENKGREAIYDLLPALRGHSEMPEISELDEMTFPELSEWLTEWQQDEEEEFITGVYIEEHEVLND